METRAGHKDNLITDVDSTNGQPDFPATCNEYMKPLEVPKQNKHSVTCCHELGRMSFDRVAEVSRAQDILELVSLTASFERSAKVSYIEAFHRRSRIKELMQLLTYVKLRVAFAETTIQGQEPVAVLAFETFVEDPRQPLDGMIIECTFVFAALRGLELMRNRIEFGKALVCVERRHSRRTETDVV